jgi:hypothetical protein
LFGFGLFIRLQCKEWRKAPHLRKFKAIHQGNAAAQIKSTRK